jgi:hypothetical protein
MWDGFVVDKVALGQVFSEYFDFLCQSSIHRLLYIHHLVIWGWYSMPISGRRTKWTQSHPTPRNIIFLSSTNRYWEQSTVSHLLNKYDEILVYMNFSRR